MHLRRGLQGALCRGAVQAGIRTAVVQGSEAKRYVGRGNARPSQNVALAEQCGQNA